MRLPKSNLQLPFKNLTLILIELVHTIVLDGANIGKIVQHQASEKNGITFASKTEIFLWDFLTKKFNFNHAISSLINGTLPHLSNEIPECFV